MGRNIGARSQRRPSYRVQFVERTRTTHGKFEASIGREVLDMAMHDLNAA